ncbi:MAG: FG-GAP repeat domain-containing protein, partial [Lysobacterales bacterium]
PGVRGASIVGLEIPGVPALAVIENSQKCNEGDFAACARLGMLAADAGGIQTGAALGSFVDSQTCLDGDDDACFTLAKEAILERVPLKGVPEGIKQAEACQRESIRDCMQLGKTLASAASGLIVAAPRLAPFGENACTSDSATKGPVDLASVWDDQQSTSIAAFPSDGAHFTAPVHVSTRNGGWARGAKWAAADFTGDGLTDVLAIWNDNKNNTFTLRQSTEFTSAVSHWAVQSGTWVGSTVWLPGDFDGDGHVDVAGAWNDQGQTSIAVYLSDGARFKAPTQWSQRDGGWGDTVKWAVGDFTGDGKADIVSVWDNGGTNTITVRQSTGAGFTPVHWASNAGGWNESSVWLAGDFNGDGRLDLAGVWHDGTAVSIAVFPSTGSQFPGWTQWSQRDGGWIDDAKWTSGDFNGDGKTDVAAIWDNGGTNTMTVRQSTGKSFVAQHWANNAGGWSPSAAWCSGQFPDGVRHPNPLETKRDHTANLPYEGVDDRITADTAVASRPTTVKAQGRVRLGGTPGAAPTTVMALCNNARIAKERNSPAAPGLEQTCLAGGGFVVLA